MDNISWSYWVERAVGHIRFKPDREAVEDELLAHLEDKTEDILHEKQVPVYEAEKLALDTMGDADEVGRQLNQVHQAWLGYLWLCSKWALIICLVVLAYAFVYFCDNGGFSADQNWIDTLVEGQMDGDYDQYQRITRLTPGCTDESDGYTFTVPQAIVWYNTDYTRTEEYEGTVYEEEIEENTALYLTVQAKTRWPSADGCRGFYCFYAVDDRGNVYDSKYLSWGSGNIMKVLAGRVEPTSWWGSEYQAYIPSIDPEAQWVELRYDRDGRDVRLRVDLTGGESV